MVKAVDHNIASSTGTGLWEGIKGAFKGGLVPILVGAAVLGLGAYAISAMFTAGAAGTLAAWIGELPIAAKIGMAAGVVGAAAGAVFAPIGAAIGGLFGASKGVKRVGAEQQKFNERTNLREQATETSLQYAQMAGAQMGYARGVQDAQAAMERRIQEMQMAAINDRVNESAEKNKGASSTKHVDAEMKRRATAAEANVQRT